MYFPFKLSFISIINEELKNKIYKYNNIEFGFETYCNPYILLDSIMSVVILHEYIQLISRII